MSVTQGLRSLAQSTPDFSNQAIENIITDLKIGWAEKSINLDLKIQNNTVLTASQKTDLKATINNVAHVNIGRIMGDVRRHIDSILDGTIVPIPEVELDVDNPEYATFLEILQTVQSIQISVAEFYGTSGAQQNRSVNDHLGLMNNKVSFTELKQSIKFLNDAGLATETAYSTAIDNLITFIDGVRDDSTDFQQTLNTFASGVATAATNFDAAIQTAPYDAKRALLISNMNTINNQRTLENSNLTTIRTYSTTLAENNAYVALADDKDLRKLIINTSQNADFKSYFENYADRELNDNPIYHNALSDSSNEQIIDSVMRLKGLPDVTDYVDLDSVARKALKDTRLKTKLKDAGKTTEQIIDRACELLSINVDNKDIYAKSKSLLSNMNANDREIVKTELDLHNQVNTLS